MSKHRLQLDFTDEALQGLDQLRDATGLPNRAEVIRQALRLLQWTITETQQKDANLLIEKGGNIRQVVFPFWSAPGNSKVAG
jgi:metal-responsive CopG/Arc/MetJ family transcriptional regulator